MKSSHHPGRRVAVIDIGTNTLLCLAAELQETGHPSSLRRLGDECRFGRLGQGLDQTGALDGEAVSRSLQILRQYRKMADDLGITEIRAVGTQALREARNAGDFTGPAQEILGAPIEIIAGEREAALVYRAVAESFPQLAGQTYAIADVGGGSTEIIVVSPGVRVPAVLSIPIGSVRLHERHLSSDPPMPEQVKRLIADIDQTLAELDLPTRVVLVGSAGTAATIASVELKLRTYDPERVQGFAMPREALERQLAHYLQLTVQERTRLPGLEPKRADVIAAGVAIFARLLARMDGAELLINERGVRWGVAYEWAAAQ